MENKITNAVENTTDDFIGEDGLLYCGKCKTRKQVKFEAFGEAFNPVCLCKCEVEEERRNKEKRETEERTQLLRKKAFSDKELLKCTFANDDMENKKMTNIMQKYVDNFENFKQQGKGLLLWGSCGTGKTFSACEVANALIEKGYSVIVTNFGKVINELQATFKKQEYIDELSSVSLLVIDDLGFERDTPFAREQVYNVINSRYLKNLPLITTTNFTIDEIKSTNDVVCKRIYDRILEKCHPIHFEGANRRRKIINKEYAVTQRMLWEVI